MKTIKKNHLVWAIALLLLLLPLATYWNTTFHDFGLRDDYANLREAHEEPGKILQFTASHARPVYGWLLQYSFEHIDEIAGLEWLRLAGAAGLGLAAAALFGLLLRVGWHWPAAGFAAAMTVLAPAAQIVAGWATAWPYPVAALLALGGFALANANREDYPWLRRTGAVLLVTASALIYQPNSLLYLVGIAAVLPVLRGQPPLARLRWVGVHLAIVAAGLAVAFLIMKLSYVAGVFTASNRIAFEADPVGKLGWFLREPLLNALNLLVLNDDGGATRTMYTVSAWITALLLAAGLGVEGWRRGGWAGGFWLLLLAILLPTALVANLAAAERFATYRTIFALTAVVLIFLTLSWQNLCSLAGRVGRIIEVSGYSILLTMAIVVARDHAYFLIALPQGEELQILQRIADRIVPREPPLRIYFVQPLSEDSPAEISYHDEFGALSTSGALVAGSDWAPKEIFKHLIRQRFPDWTDRERYYQLQAGIQPPLKDQLFDLIIDMRQIRRFGPLYAGPVTPNVKPNGLELLPR
ncbi:MAG: hypothetical protein LM523_00320 [Candidatus Contendobacter sp.]|nr:hypothetical protein [Candidatus Contendobacter sp.]